MEVRLINQKYSFLKSALSSEGSFLPTKDILPWVRTQSDLIKTNISLVDFSKLKDWKFDKSGFFCHKSGRFFTIKGIDIKTNWGHVHQWQQPIIDQPEVGFLGFLVKEIRGVLHFLIQAKIEPGNINLVQLSPTLQATKSNYSQAHEGNKPLYFEYFENLDPKNVLIDQLQSEQGARFLRKRNRNLIVKTDKDVPLFDNFTWLSLAQIKNLMRHDNLVNMDTRTVLSCIDFYFEDHHNELFDIYAITKKPLNLDFLGSALCNQNSLKSINDILNWLTGLKVFYQLEVCEKSLFDLKQWIVAGNEIAHEEGKFFKVIAANIEIEGREKSKWGQPMVQPAQDGLCAFLCKKINGIMHFAVQAKLECGNRDLFEFAPTVQCLTGNYKLAAEGSLPFLDYVITAKKEMIYFDSMQSEEGGRFYHEQNRNMIIIADDDFPEALPPNYFWMTLNQIGVFLKFNNYLNIQARSLIAAICFD